MPKGLLFQSTIQISGLVLEVTLITLETDVLCTMLKGEVMLKVLLIARASVHGPLLVQEYLTVFPQPPCSPDLASANYYLF
jgi:hypothetical protein